MKPLFQAKIGYRIIYKLACQTMYPYKGDSGKHLSQIEIE